MKRPSHKRTRKPRPASDADTPGFAARKAAADVLLAILERNRALEEAVDPRTGPEGLAALEDRDHALVRMLVATVLRRLGTLRALLNGMMEGGAPKNTPQVEIALLLGAAQILLLDVPDHAAVDLSVRLASGVRNARYAGLVNAVLRRVTREGRARYDALDMALDTPEWLRERWIANYGWEVAAAIMQAHRQEPPLDLTVKSDPERWAEQLGGIVLPNGTVRIAAAGAVTALPGFTDGDWWVQDAAASLPARLLGDIAGNRVADLCAAPGGKTAQLAAASAEVVAVDRSETRMRRLRENLVRLNLSAETIVADALSWENEPFDAVLLDAPCSATGTVRRHPDIPWQKKPADLAPLVALQARLLDRATALVKPGGTLIYATCSLEPEEGEAQLEGMLARHANFTLDTLRPAELPGLENLFTTDGWLRSLPCHLPHENPRLAGCDGFFAARLRRIS